MKCTVCRTKEECSAVAPIHLPNRHPTAQGLHSSLVLLPATGKLVPWPLCSTDFTLGFLYYWVIEIMSIFKSPELINKKRKATVLDIHIETHHTHFTSTNSSI